MFPCSFIVWLWHLFQNLAALRKDSRGRLRGGERVRFGFLFLSFFFFFLGSYTTHMYLGG